MTEDPRIPFGKGWDLSRRLTHDAYGRPRPGAAYCEGLRPVPPIRTLAPGPPGRSQSAQRLPKVCPTSAQRLPNVAPPLPQTPSPGLKPWPLQWPESMLSHAGSADSKHPTGSRHNTATCSYYNVYDTDFPLKLGDGCDL